MRNARASAERSQSRPRGLLVALAAFALVGLDPARPASARAAFSPARSAPDPHVLYLKAGAFDPLRDPPPGRGFAARPTHAKSGRGAYVVLFEEPITGADRSALEGAGALIGGSLPAQALEVVMTEAQRASVAALPGVRWVGPYQAAWKLSSPRLEAFAAESGATPLPPRVGLRLTLFTGVHDEAIAALRGLGARVLRACLLYTSPSPRDRS